MNRRNLIKAVIAAPLVIPVARAAIAPTEQREQPQPPPQAPSTRPYLVTMEVDGGALGRGWHRFWVTEEQYMQLLRVRWE